MVNYLILIFKTNFIRTCFLYITLKLVLSWGLMSSPNINWYKENCSRWCSDIFVNGDGEIEEVSFVEILDFDEIYYKEYLEWWNSLAIELEMYELLSGI